MKINDRVFCFYELKIKSKTKSGNPGPSLSVKDAFNIIANLPYDCLHPRRTGTRQIFGIDDIKISNNKKGAILLFYRSDLEESAPSVRDHVTEEIRELQRGSTEGNSYSSHVLVIFNEKPQVPAKLIIEQCKGVGPTRIETTLRQVFSKYKKIRPSFFEQNIIGNTKDESGNIIKESISFDFEITGIPSNSFISDLNNGELIAFELVQEGKLVEKFDEEAYFEEKEAVVRLQVSDKSAISSNRFQEVNRVLQSWKKDYSKARLRIKPRNAKEYTIDWSAEDGFSEEYVKKVQVSGFSPKLKSSYKKIYEPIAERMISESNKNA